MLQRLCLILGFFSLFLIAPSGTVQADDREDAKALVGTWKCTESLFGASNGHILGLKGDGKWTGGNNFETTWKVKGGKLVRSRIVGGDLDDKFELSPDGTTLKLGSSTYKLQK